jgi:hypothetical protein
MNDLVVTIIPKGPEFLQVKAYQKRDDESATGRDY